MAFTLLMVGGGKMGSALLGGLLSSGWASAEEIAVVEPHEARRAELATEFPGMALLDVPTEGLLAPDGDRLSGAVLAVKPDVAEGACRALGATGVRRVLSIVAGVPSARLYSSTSSRDSRGSTATTA